MDVNVLVFRRDMVQPPAVVGQISDIINISENPGSGVDYVNGDIHVMFALTGTNRDFCEELKAKTKKLVILPTDDLFDQLLAGTLNVTHEELQPYVVDA